MDTILDLGESVFIDRCTRENSPESRRYESTSIEGRKWEEIEDSEIDRDHSDDHGDHLPSDTNIDE